MTAKVQLPTESGGKHFPGVETLVTRISFWLPLFVNRFFVLGHLSDNLLSTLWSVTSDYCEGLPVNIVYPSTANNQG